MGFVIFALIAIVVLILVSGAYVFTVACLRRKDVPWLVKEELKKTPMGKYHEFIVGSDQWLKDHHAKDVYIRSEDDLQLHGLWVPAKDAKGTIVLAHGYRSTYLLDFCAAMPFFHELGMNLLIPQQRAQGKSQGKFITFGVKESGDMLNWLQWHKDTAVDVPVFLFGISMGASTMLYLANKEMPVNIRGIIADCGFTSPKEIIVEVFHRVIHLPAIPTIWVADLFSRMFAGFSLYQKDTRKILKNSKYPILLIHGTEDAFVPCTMSKEGFATCKEPKQLLLVDGADHGLSFLVDTEKYMDSVIDFIKKYLN